MTRRGWIVLVPMGCLKNLLENTCGPGRSLPEVLMSHQNGDTVSFPYFVHYCLLQVHSKSSHSCSFRHILIAYVADWKVSLATPEAKHEIKDHSTENFLKQLDETSSFLGEYIDLYQIHSATFDSGILDDARAHQALADCREERGWLIGLSVSGPQQDEILRIARKIRVKVGETERSLFDSVQCTFNVLEQRPAEALREASDAGMDIIIKEGLANGRALQHPALVQYAQTLSCGVDQLALAFILAQEFSPRVLSGAVTSEQLLSNLKAQELAKKLQDTPELLDEIGNACVMESEEYWKDRSALKWN